jgi:hypothetical protein
MMISREPLSNSPAELREPGLTLLFRGVTEALANLSCHHLWLDLKPFFCVGILLQEATRFIDFSIPP